MTKRVLILLLFLFISTQQILLAQNPLIDSLETARKNYISEDTVRVLLLNELAYEIYTVDINKTLKYAEEALELAQKLDFRKEEANSLRLIGIYYNMKSNYPMALEYLQKALILFEELNINVGITECLNSIGIIYYNQGNNKQALENYEKALEYLKTSNDLQNISFCLNNIGVIHYDQKEFLVALDYFNESLEIDKKLNNKEGVCIGLNNIGEIYRDLNIYDTAIIYFDKSLALAFEIEDQYGISYLYKDYGSVYILTNNYQKALNYSKKSLKIALEYEYIDIQKDVYLQLSNIYKSTNQYKKAFENFTKYKALSDSIFNEENIKKTADLESLYKFQKEKQALELEQQKKDAIQKEKNKRQKLVTNSLILIALLLTIAVVSIFKGYKQKQKSNRLLSDQYDEIESKNQKLLEQNEEIHELNEELLYQKDELENHRNHLEELVKKRTSDLEISKEKAEESDRLKSAFLANMSHEIRTPLNAIIGFSSLFQDPELTDKEIEELNNQIHYSSDTLLKLIDDIIDIAKIESGQLSIFKENISINEVLEKLHKAFDHQALLISKKIDLKIKSPDKDLIVKTDPLRIQQILVNLIDNAIKFTEQGEIRVGIISSYNQKELTFFVKDTGIGLNNDQKEIIFKRFSKIEDKKRFYRGAGLGLAISKNLVELLGGRIWVESEKNTGSTFYFSIPILDEF